MTIYVTSEKLCSLTTQGLIGLRIILLLSYPQEFLPFGIKKKNDISS